MQLEDVYKFSFTSISLTTIERASHAILKSTYTQPMHFHLIAASTYYRINSNLDLQNSLRNAVNYCDSRPLCSWISLKSQKCPQIRGTDLLREVLSLSGTDTGHFFIGTTDENLDHLKNVVRTTYPNVKISGSFAPPFTTPTASEIKEWASRVNASGARIVWISLGSPKQDIVAAKLAEYCHANVVAVGAALDFITGTKKESPKVLQKMHLEWLFRFAQEPQRLWKRYTLGLLYFIYLIIKDMIGENKESIV